MISIREMTAADEGAVMEMVDRFYHSPAVEHEVDLAVLRRSFQAAVDPAEPLIQGLVLEELAPGVTVEEVVSKTEAELIIPEHIGCME